MDKVEGYKAYEKDTKTGNIVNVDKSAYEARLKAKQRVERLDKIEDDVKDIKNLLQELLARTDI